MTKRLQITVSDDVYEKVMKITKEYGFTASAFCALTIMNYFDQREAIASLGTLPTMMEQYQSQMIQTNK